MSRNAYTSLFFWIYYIWYMHRSVFMSNCCDIPCFFEILSLYEFSFGRYFYNMYIY